MAIKKVYEIQGFGEKLYVYQGLESDVAELLTKINATSGINKKNLYNTGDTFECLDGNCNTYAFEEGSNQWHLQA